MPDVFVRKLLRWHQQNPRPLPWNHDSKNPYHIWVSEIIMQQTRIEQGAGYYKRFIDTFPDVFALANATLDSVISVWQGLGYYSRARNIHAAAKMIVSKFDGAFPSTYEGLISLPGIGPYSAAAIGSFAFGLSKAVVDGNVKRLIARHYGIRDSIDTPAGHDRVLNEATRLIKDADPALFNQALMNFGSLVCKPASPLCDTCPLSSNCFAYNNNMVSALPVRSKKISLRDRYFHFVALQYKSKVLLQKREAKDIWEGLYSFPVIEERSLRSPGTKKISAFIASGITAGSLSFVPSRFATKQQTLSHQYINARLHLVQIASPGNVKDDNCIWVAKEDMDRYGKPRIVNDFLKEVLE